MPPVAVAPVVRINVSRNPRSVSGAESRVSVPETPRSRNSPASWVSSARPLTCASMPRSPWRHTSPCRGRPREAGLRVAAVMAHANLKARHELSAARRNSAPDPFEPSRSRVTSASDLARLPAFERSDAEVVRTTIASEVAASSGPPDASASTNRPRRPSAAIARSMSVSMPGCRGASVRRATLTRAFRARFRAGWPPTA